VLIQAETEQGLQTFRDRFAQRDQTARAFDLDEEGGRFGCQPAQ